MIIGDLLSRIHRGTLDNLLPLTMVQTKADIKKYIADGYCVGMTANEFSKKYPLLPIENVYVSPNFMDTLYYGDLKNETIPILLGLQIYDDKRLVFNNETDEEFQTRILRMANRIASGDMNYIKNYFFSLNSSFRLSVLSKYISLSKPSANLYKLFISLYSISDYGIGCFGEEDIQKILSGKTEAQKKETAKKLADFPDTITVYRGEGDKSVPYTQAFSWTTSYKTACFFACRINNAEDSRIITATVNKADVIEYLDNTSENEIIVAPASVTMTETTVLYGMRSLEQQTDAICEEFWKYRKQISLLYKMNGKSNSGHDALHTLRVLFNALLLIELQKYQLSEKERCQLCEAIVYHDIGRTNDAADDTHGTKSAQIYMTMNRCDELETVFLIKYHCIDDDVAYTALEKSDIPNKDRVWLLYTILKDADALDRVRFGMREIDPKYFRNKMAVQLLPAAQNAVVGIQM